MTIYVLIPRTNAAIASDDPVEIVARAIHGAVAVECGGVSDLAGNPARWSWETQCTMKRQDAGATGTHADYYRRQARAAILAMPQRKEPPALKTDSERDAEIERIAALLGHDSNGSEFTQALAAIRRLYAPPALPAEVEAVVAALHENCQCFQRPTFADPPCAVCKGEALLRRYAQAVAEKDAEIARLTSEIAGPCPCDVHACLSAVAKRDKKLQAVEALCVSREALGADSPCYDEACGCKGCIEAKEIRAILREEH